MGPPGLEDVFGPGGLGYDRQDSFSGSGSKASRDRSRSPFSGSGIRSGTSRSGTPNSRSGTGQSGTILSGSGYGTPDRRRQSMYEMRDGQGKKLALGSKYVINLNGRDCGIRNRRSQKPRFGQQEFEDKMWPVWFYTPVPCGMCSIMLGLVMIALGISFLIMDANLQDIRLEYSSKDKLIRFDLENDMAGPVFLYYELSGFYGNYRSFVESKDDFVFSSTFAKYNCEMSKFKDDVGFVRPDDTAFERLVEKTSTELRPCGMVALTFFMDEYSLVYESGDNALVTLDESDISWLSDDDILDSKMVTSGPNVLIEEEMSWLTTAHLEHFKVWYRTSASSKFRQLWAKIPDGLRPGRYMMNFTKNDAVWDEQWNVKKAVVLAQLGAFGTKNALLGYLYIAWGLVLMIGSVLVYYGLPSCLVSRWLDLTEPVARPVIHQEGNQLGELGGLGTIESRPSTNSIQGLTGDNVNADDLVTANVRRNSKGTGFVISSGPRKGQEVGERPSDESSKSSSEAVSSRRPPPSPLGDRERKGDKVQAAKHRFRIRGESKMLDDSMPSI
eukprot:gnl/MRDRNA2_/MRDRNA2_56457_c0_seq1.p1 gnl/MRDRNA2_/MRDRNA2_56457_c0~~gnl/MRDRNA2_/MRDRNA2_56457_c0_seq1.p1  ORF type:complete len:597 (-),score=87.71 gnl/MRDRNA2_/MRDRNA2_56457_c0_seq1:19-1686(-)